MKGITYHTQKILGLLIIKFFDLLVKIFSQIQAYYPETTFPELKEIQNAWKDIRDEYYSYTANNSLDNMSEIFIEQDRIAPKDNWKNVMLLIYGEPILKHQIYFPLTTQLIQNHKTIQTAFFSVLPPGKKIDTHKGPYKGVLRYHLGLDIPQSKECYLEIETNRYYWEEGEVLIFDDTFTHRAQNMSNDYRVILFIDVLRPLPSWLHFINTRLLKLMQQSQFIQNVLRILETKQIEN